MTLKWKLMSVLVVASFMLAAFLTPTAAQQQSPEERKQSMVQKWLSRHGREADLSAAPVDSASGGLNTAAVAPAEDGPGYNWLYQFNRMWGMNDGVRPYDEPENFHTPYGITVDSTGRVYVADMLNHKVKVFAADGTFLFEFGGEGTGLGDLTYPVLVETNASGNLLVFGLINRRVQEFNLDGTPTGLVIPVHVGQGFIETPGGMATDTAGNLYITDYHNGVVKKYDSNGNYLLTFSSNGTGTEDLLRPTGMVVDSSGDLLVLDSGNGRLQVFDSDGVHQKMVLFFGGLYTMIDIAIDSMGFYWITDSFSHELHKYTPVGTHVGSWGGRGYGDGEFQHIFGVAISSDDYVYTTDFGRFCVQKFNTSGDFQLIWGTNDGQPYFGSAPGEFYQPEDVVVSPDGFVYVLDTMNHRVQKFTASGTFVSEWGEFGSAEGQLWNPAAIARNSLGHIIVADQGNSRVQIFTEDGTFVRSFGSHGTGDNQFDNLQAIAVGPDDSIYTGCLNQYVKKFTPEGDFLLKWGGSSATEPGKFRNIQGIAVNNYGRVAVVDIYRDDIQIFNHEGELITSRDGLIGPRDVAFDDLGFVYIAEYYYVCKYDRNLTIVDYIGGEGYKAGDLGFWNGIDVAPNDELYVADREYHRVQVFRPIKTGSLQVTLSPARINDNASGWKLENQVAWRPSGDIQWGIFLGDYRVVFKPLEGFRTPNPQLVTIRDGEMLSLDIQYQPVGTADSGLNVIFTGLPGFDSGDFGWRRRGSGNGYTMGGGLVGLPPGTHIIEFLPLPGWFAPPMEVEISETAGVTIRPVYFPLLPTGSNDFPADGAGDPILWNQQTGVWTLADGLTWNMGGKHGWPVPGDYNGDGEMEPAAWLPKQGLWRVRGQFELENFGQTGDFPVPGDYDGDGKTDPALYRQSTGEWLISFSSTRNNTVNRAEVAAQTSPVKGVPMPGDYDGDGVIEGAVYDADSFTWFIPGQPNVEYGHPGFVPVPADYDGDGITDLAIANIAKGFYLIRGGKRHDVATEAGDIPSMIDYDGDGKADFSWYRPSEGVWYFDDGTSITFGGEDHIPVTR